MNFEKAWLASQVRKISENVAAGPLLQQTKLDLMLWRRWSDAPSIAFLLLNPSIADEAKPDRTMQRCIGFAASHGYGGIEIFNLCSFVSTNPKKLRKLVHSDHFTDNHQLVQSELQDRDVILAYGTNARYARFPESHREQLAHSTRTYYLDITASGYPSHPLYLDALLRMKRCSLISGMRIQPLDEEDHAPGL